MGRIAHFASAALVTLMTAAICLAVPALAHAADRAPSGTAGASDPAAAPNSSTQAPATAPQGPGTQAPSSAPGPSDTPAVEGAEGTAYAFGGIQLTLPDGFDVVDLGSMMLASNADASVVASAMPAAGEADVPASTEEWPAFFAPLAQATADEAGASLTDGGIFTLADAAQASLFTLAFAADGMDAQVAQFYVPLADGSFTLVQITVNAAVDGAAELGDAIAQTLMLATPEAVQLGSEEGAGAPTSRVEAGGIAFDLPQGYAETTSPDGDPTWHIADGTVMLTVMSGLVEGIDELGDETYGLIAEGIAVGLDGIVEGSATLENASCEVRVYVFTFSSDGETFMGALGMVPLADDSVTGVLALAPMSRASEVDELVETAFSTIGPAA